MLQEIVSKTLIFVRDGIFKCFNKTNLNYKTQIIIRNYIIFPILFPIFFILNILLPSCRHLLPIFTMCFVAQYMGILSLLLHFNYLLKFDINAGTEISEPLLYYAIYQCPLKYNKNQNLRIIKYLLDCGADPNTKFNERFTLFSHLCFGHLTDEFGQNPNRDATHHIYDNIYINDVILLCIKHGINVNTTSLIPNYSPILCTIRDNNITLAKILCKKNINLNQTFTSDHIAINNIIIANFGVTVFYVEFKMFKIFVTYGMNLYNESLINTNGLFYNLMVEKRFYKSFNLYLQTLI